MPAPIIDGPGAAVTLSLKQHELVRAVYDPKAPAGVAPSAGG
jgi:hypothetical protein